MIRMMTSCGRCRHYTDKHRCGNKDSKYYDQQQFSNVCWNCPDFSGEKYAWDTDKAIPMGERPSTFGRVDPRDPTKFISEQEYQRLLKEGRK